MYDLLHVKQSITIKEQMTMKQKRIAASELETMSLRNWPELATKSPGIVWRLNRATNQLHSVLDAKIAERGIQPGDFEVLVV